MSNEVIDEKYLGSSLDDFLKEEGILDEAELYAAKARLAYEIQQLMRQQNLSKTTMAQRMQTSRAAVDRILDPENHAVTLMTMEKAATALGKRLHISLV